MVLVDQSERFVFKPMLYELLSGGKVKLLSSCSTVFFFILLCVDLVSNSFDLQKLMCGRLLPVSRICLQTRGSNFSEIE